MSAVLDVLGNVDLLRPCEDLCRIELGATRIRDRVGALECVSDVDCDRQDIAIEVGGRAIAITRSAVNASIRSRTRFVRGGCGMSLFGLSEYRIEEPAVYCTR
jgi:hypothetical protein